VQSMERWTLNVDDDDDAVNSWCGWEGRDIFGERIWVDIFLGVNSDGLIVGYNLWNRAYVNNLLLIMRVDWALRDRLQWQVMTREHTNCFVVLDSML